MFWEDDKESIKIPFSGIPFVIVGYDVRECQHGPDRNARDKMKGREKKALN